MRPRIAASVVLFAILALTVAYDAHAQQFQWGVQFGGASGSADSRAVAVDANSNLYCVGFFTGTVDFDPGPGVQNLTAVSGLGDLFISKVDANGNFIWAKQVGGVDAQFTSNDFFGMAIAIAGNGNVHVAGGFIGTVDFDPGPGTQMLTSTGGLQYTDGFILKLDTNGNFIWARQLGNGPHVNDNGVTGVAVDVAGNVFTVGMFQGVVDFDPGPGTFTVESAGVPTTFQDAFVHKLNSNGNFVWVKQLGGTNSDQATAVTLDPQGNIYTVGRFRSDSVFQTDYDPGPGEFILTSVGDYDTFVSKLDRDGNFVAAGQMGGAGLDGATGVALDRDGSLYVTGRFQGLADFDPGVDTHNLTGSGLVDAFVVKLDPSLALVWAERFGGDLTVDAFGIAVGSNGSVYIAGGFRGTADFDPGPGTYNLVAAANQFDPFIAKLDRGGHLVWAGQLEGTSSDFAFGVVLDSGENVVICGTFAGTIDIDPGAAVDNLTATQAGFLLKLAPTGAGEGSAESAATVPLTVTRTGGSLVLSWGSSCQAGDVDYEIYEGAIGDFTSHVPIACSTGGATTMSISPAAGDSYYLVVPSTGTVEGSYGKNSLGVQRPMSVSACLPQSILACP